MARTGIKYHILSESEFTQIKVMQSAGLKNLQVQKVLGNNRTTSTIGRVSKFDNLESYRKAMVDKANQNKAKLKQAAPDKPYFVQHYKFNPAEVEQSPSDNFSNVALELGRVASALERLADAWESSPTKRRLF